MHWFFLSDLPEVNGHGHLYYFWPVYAVISGILAAVEYGIVKDKL